MFDAAIHHPHHIARHYCNLKGAEEHGLDGASDEEKEQQCVLPKTEFVHQQLLGKGYSPP